MVMVMVMRWVSGSGLVLISVFLSDGVWAKTWGEYHFYDIYCSYQLAACVWIW